jgi:ADP-heptose:LPS heptosyltransferase
MNQFYLKLKRYLTLWHFKRALIFIFVDLILLSFVRRGKSEAVLVLKYDQLGDYMLVRNFFRSIRNHPIYKTKRIVFLGNLLLKDVVECYDANNFDEFIWIDRSHLLDGVWKRFKILRRIKRLGPQIVIHPMYGLESYAGDCIVRASGARQRYGRSLCYQAKEGKEHGEVCTGPFLERRHILFDFYRNKQLFSAFLPGVALPKDTRLDVIAVPLPEVARPFAVLMPGASDAFREWPTDSFAQVARHLFEARGLRIVILGTKADAPKGEAIRRTAATVPLENLCGKLTLPQVIYLMSRAALGITNDSGGIHVLAALNKPGVAVSNGFSIKFFHPYPREISESVSFIYPPAFYALPGPMERIRMIHGEEKHFPIGDVSPESVIERIEALLEHRPFRDAIQEMNG